MKPRILQKTFAALVVTLPTLVIFSNHSSAADVTAVVNNGDWVAAATWSPSGVPSSGNNYLVPNAIGIDGYTGASTSSNVTRTFGGGSLTIQNGGSLFCDSNHSASYPDWTYTINNLKLENGGSIHFRGGAGTDFFLTNGFTLASGATAAIRHSGGSYDQRVRLGPVSGPAGSTIQLLATHNPSSGTYKDNYANVANSSFAGNWFVDYTTTAEEKIRLRADAANSLGTGTVTLDDRARLEANAANALNSLSGIVLSKSTSELVFNGANAWNNTGASLTLNAGTVTLPTSNSAIGSLNLADTSTINSTGGTLAMNSILATAGTTGGTAILVPAASATIANTGAVASATIACGLALSQSGIVFNISDTNPSGSDLFLTGPINSSAGFTKNGAGALSFNNNTNVTGLVTHDAGIIQISAAPAKSFTGGLTGTGQINVGGTGKVTLSGASGSYTGSIIVLDGANLAGEAVTNANLTVGGTTGANLWPDFSTPTGAFTANNITLNGVNNIRFDTYPAAGTYTLLKYNGVLTGSAANFAAPFRGASINTTGGVGGNEITLTIGAPASLVWNNADANLTWDNGSSANWDNAGSNDVFFEPDTVVFNDTPGANQAIAVSGTVNPASTTFAATNDTVNYSFSGGSIGGSGNLVKNGDATLTLAQTNSYSGGTTLNEGRLRVGADNALGTGPLTINGGILSSDGTSPWTLANNLVLNANPAFGNAVDHGMLTVTGSLNLDTSRTITTLSDVTLSGVLSGAFSLTKQGAGTLSLTGTNTYSGAVTVSQGILATALSTTSNSLGSGPVTIDSGTALRVENTNTNTATGPTLANTITGSGVIQYNFASSATSRNAYITGLSGFTGTLRLSNSGTTGDKLTASAGINAPGASVIVDSGSQLNIATNPSTFSDVRISGTGNNENRGAIRLGSTLNANITLVESATIGSEGGTINGTITSGATGTQTLTVGTTNATGNSNFLGAIGGGTGTIELVKVAGGTITLAAANTYTGNTYIDAGTLNLTGSIAGDLFVSNAAAATVSGEGSAGGEMTFGASGGLGASLTINPTTAGALTSTGSFNVAESVTVVSVGFSTVPATGGTFAVINHGGTTASPANFAFSGTGYRPHSFNTTANPNQVTLTVPSESLTWLGTSAVWDVNNTANWKSATVDPEKFYQLDAVTFDDAANNTDPALAVTVTPSSVTFNNSTKAYTLTGAGAIGGLATLNKTGANTVTVSTANTFSGDVSITGGKLLLGNAAALGATDTTGTRKVTVTSGGQLDFNGISPGTTRGYTYRIAGNGGGTGAITNSSATAVGANSGIFNLELLDDATIGGAGRYDIARLGTVSGTITGNGNTLTKADANQVNLRGDASGLTIIVNGGILGAEDSDLALGGASGNVTVNDTAVLGVWGARTLATPVRLNSGSTLRTLGGAAATWSGPITLGGNAIIEGNAGNVMNLSGSLAETGGAHTLQIRNTTTTGGSYTFNLSNTSTRTGPTTLSGSLFKVLNNSALGTGPVTIQSNGTAGVVTRLDLSGVTVANDINLSSSAQTAFFGPVTAVDGLTSTVSGTLNVTSGVGNGGHFASSGAGSVLRITGTINSTGAIPNIRQGTVEMGTTGGNLTQLQQGEGTLRLISNNGIQTTLRLNLAVSSAGTFDLNGFNQTLAELRRNGAPAATVTNTSGNPSLLTIDGTVNHDFTGTIDDGTGGIAVSKNGNSVWTLTGANTYTGNTTVNGGTLRVNGSTGSGPVHVAASGTLGGTGTINGPITVNGILAPGASAGILITNEVTFGTGSTLAWEVDDWTGTIGTGWDLVDATDITFNNTPASKLTVRISGTAANFTEANKTFTIATALNSIAGFNASAIQIDDSAFSGNGTWAIQQNGNAIELAYTAGAGNTYATWAATYAGNQAADLDYDGDGVANGVEYFMGVTTPGFTAKPSIINGKVTWPMSPNFVGSYVVKTSPDLVNWTTATSGVVETTGVSVEYTLPTGDPKRFARIEVTIP